ncbi:hypothetical protein HBO13_30615 [Pseudomonas lactis]|uniref:Uncharacterized protein n=1 Tax=Pseudomonas lactis TaxID=1615674 RepID=A0A7Y1M875_9PSED|nr:hypothetical protein [Pseudomonas lactis]NNA76990.1 hypothetical protein [Pseudomonas lactis]
MATKTSKRSGETTTTVSVGIRIDPKIKFALDIMGRLQKRSLTAVIEWAISNAIANQKIDVDGDVEVSLSKILDKIWSTDESTRLVKLCFDMPQAITYDELRIWETIKASSYFWHTYPDGSFDTTPEKIDLEAVRLGWPDLMTHVERYKMSSTIIPIESKDIIPF